MVRILYLHNKDEWALHNVGKLWFKSMPPGVSVDMLSYHSLEDGLTVHGQNYDFIWFGYLLMYMQFYYDPDKSIVSVHDPMELFPQIKDWKSGRPLESSLSVLQSLKHIATISIELQELLRNNSIIAHRISTTTLLPVRQVAAHDLGGRPVVISVANSYPRKQLDLLQKIGEHLDKLGVQYEFKIGSGILPVDEYMHKLDASSIYICTSFQEGGPLPAMDAMARGCIVLTTPVGQMLELIKNGVNGFFCSTESEFVDKINLLMHESECFEKMRLNAIQTIRRERSEDIISEQVAAFLKSVID